MQIDGRDSDPGSGNSYIVLALEPPGNIARDLALFKRAVFSARGEPSCLFLPEIAVLASARSPSSPAVPRIEARRALEDAWSGVTEGFASRSPVVLDGLCYLDLAGPIELLASRSRKSLKRLALESCDDAPVEAGRGFFLCCSSGSELERGILASAPTISFRDCFLVMLLIRFGSPPLKAASWRELARSKRPTGPSLSPSKRRRR
jgi:hypothetical protein